MPKQLNNVKEDILAVTRQLMKETGFAELNIRKIAAECGVATGTVYNYYSSKYEIIAEILLKEWNLMLRRIDQNTKSAPNMIDKLEIMFNELSFFMTNVHGSWLDSYPVDSPNKIEFTEIKDKKKILKNQVCEKVYSFTRSDKAENEDAKDICDIISNILISYSNDESEFKKIKISLLALVNELNKIV